LQTNLPVGCHWHVEQIVSPERFQIATPDIRDLNADQTKSPLLTTQVLCHGLLGHQVQDFQD
jgi:hypothetical protein